MFHFVKIAWEVVTLAINYIITQSIFRLKILFSATAIFFNTFGINLI